MLWDVHPVDSTLGYFLSSVPIVWNNLVLIGTAGADWGANAQMFAFDVTDGHQVWTFDEIVPETFGSADAASTGGGSNWTSYTLDTATGLLYVPVGNPAPDFAPQYRPGDNLYTNSVIVLDAKTGKLERYYQQIPNDAHDWDTAAAPIVFTLTQPASATGSSASGGTESGGADTGGAESGGAQAANRESGGAESGGAASVGQGTTYVAVANKGGYLYVYNDQTKELVYKVKTTTFENEDVAPTQDGTHVCPGITGGVEWNGPAYDPQSSMIFVNSVDWCTTYRLGEIRYSKGELFFGGTYTPDPVAQANGWLNAYDAASGKVAWTYKSDEPLIAAVTPTAGGLVFTGELNGNFTALDAQTGDVLYTFNTGGPIGGGVATYEAGGQQYIAVASGNGASRSWSPDTGAAATLLLFTLPKTQ